MDSPLRNRESESSEHTSLCSSPASDRLDQRRKDLYRNELDGNGGCESAESESETTGSESDVSELQEEEILEPPALKREDRLTATAVKKDNQFVESNLKECETRVEWIKTSLKKTKTSIEAVNLDILQLQKLIETCLPPEKKITLTNQKLLKHKEIMTLIKNEDKLNADLDVARRALAEARLQHQNQSLNMDAIKQELLEDYEARKEFEYKRRVLREDKMRKNAHIVRAKALKNWATKIQNRIKRNSTEPSVLVMKPGLSASAAKKLRSYRLKMHREIAEAKALAEAEEAKRKNKRYHNMIHFKEELDKQRNILWAENQDRKLKRERKRKFREQMMRDLKDAGENPYLVDRMLEVEIMKKKQAEGLANFEFAIMKKVREEFEQQDRAKAKEKRFRERWDRFWESKARQKRRLAALENMKFLDIDAEPELALPERLDMAVNAFTVEPNFEKANELFNFDLIMEEKGVTSWKGRESEKPKVEQHEVKIQSESGEPSRTEAKFSIDSTASGASDAVSRINKSKSQRFRKVSDASSAVTAATTKSRYTINTEADETLETIPLKDAEPECPDVPSNLLKLTETKGTLVAPFKLLPELVIFKDFELDKIYKKKVVVLNRTTERLKFYLKEFVDTGSVGFQRPENTQTVNKHTEFEEVGEVEAVDHGPVKFASHKKTEEVRETQPPLITDVMKIDFTVPPSVCPGLAHNFFLVFTPNRLGDFQGEIRFDSPGGPFMLPVQCLRKRFMPNLNPEKLVFKNVIGGTSAQMSVALRNTGANPGNITRFYVMEESRNSVSNYVTPREEDTVILHFSPHGSLKESEDVEEESEEQLSEFLTHAETQDPVVEPKPDRMSDGSEDANQIQRTYSQDPLEEPVIAIVEHVFTLSIPDEQRFLVPHDEVLLQVHFNPPIDGHYANKFKFEFDDEETEPLILEVEGTTFENPITAEPRHCNLKICLMNFNYQQPISIFNGSKFHGNITGLVPTCLHQYVSVHPHELHSTPGHSVNFSIQLRPRSTMDTKENLKAVYDPDTKILDFPVHFFLEFPFPTPGPLACTIQALLSEACLEINPMEIDMGKCLTSETVRKRITMKNTSVVPQHFGAFDLPKYASIQPNNGFGTILPNETIDLDLLISLAPHTVGILNFHIKFKTLELSEYSIPVKVIGKTTNIQLSHCYIIFPRTCVDSVSSTVIEVFSSASPVKMRSNLTSLHGLLTKFEFMIPKRSSLEINPRVGYLEPGKRIEVLVQFQPKIEETQVRENLHHVLRKEFETNKVNLQHELEAIQELLQSQVIEEEPPREESLRPDQKPRNSRGDRKLSHESGNKKQRNSRGERKESHESGRKRRETNVRKISEGNRRRSSEKKQVDKSARPTLVKESSHHLDMKITCLEDLQLIYSDGKIDPRDLADLPARQRKIIRALMAEFEPSFLPVFPGSLDYERSKRDLMHHLGERSHAYNVACIVTSPDLELSTLLVTVRCPTRKPDIVVLEDHVCNFGPVGISTSLIKEVHVYNVSKSELNLKVDIINPYGPFVRINALRKLAPENVFTLRFKFTPEASGKYEEVVNIFGGESRISMALRGSGVHAEFNILPIGSVVDVGITRPQDIIVYEFKIQNTSVLDLDLEIEAEEGGTFGTEESVNVATHVRPRRRSKLGPNSTPNSRRPSGETNSGKNIEQKTSSPEQQDHDRRPSKEHHRKRQSQDRRQSNEKGRHEAKRHSQDKRLSNAKRSSHEIKRLSRDSQGLIFLPPTPPKYLGKFDIQSSDAETPTEIGFHEMVQTLHDNNLPAFIGPPKTHVHVEPNGTASFEICFIPMENKNFTRKFFLRLFGKVVHKFTIMGIGDENYVPLPPDLFSGDGE